MGDAAEVWNMVRDAKKERHQKTFARCVQQMRDYPYKVDVRELAPAHWRITHGQKVVDFWPTSGRYIGIKHCALNGTARDFNDVMTRIEREGTL